MIAANDVEIELLSDLVEDLVAMAFPATSSTPTLRPLVAFIEPRETYRKKGFIPALKAQARLGLVADRSLTTDQRRDLRRALRDDDWMENVRCDIAKQASAEGWPDKAGIIDWVKEHWLQILQIMLALLPLFLSKHPA